jgi:regulatory protein
MEVVIGLQAELSLEMPRVTAIEPQERHKGRVSVFVDGRFALGLFEDVAAALGLRVGQEVTPERLAEAAAAETRRRAKEDAYRLLSFRARAEREIADRLRRKGYDETVVTETVESLRKSGFLNDETFASGWVEARGRTRGNRALAHELRQKGVDAETTARALAEARDDETERAAARAAAVKKVGERPSDRSREARARLTAYLQRRGFGWGVIRPVLNELYAGAEEDETMIPEDD